VLLNVERAVEFRLFAWLNKPGVSYFTVVEIQTMSPIAVFIACRGACNTAPLESDKAR
jgi:hypothetical protein